MRAVTNFWAYLVAITTLTDDGIEELKDMLRDARQSQEDWLNFRNCPACCVEEYC